MNGCIIRRNQKFIHIVKIVLLLLLPLLLSLISIDKLDGENSICLFKNIFGRNCYGCGITKSVLSVIQFQFERAYHYNKLIVVVMPLLFYVWVKEIVKTVHFLLETTRHKKSN